MRNDVPIHLHASDPSTGRVAAALKARVFDCEICDARWGWKDGSGWYLRTPNRSGDKLADADYAGEH